MQRLTRTPRFPYTAVLATWALLTLAQASVWAASHSDAPLIKQDPQANITDVYAFIGTKYDTPGQTVLNVIMHTRPYSEPSDGVMYDRFADDARYSIHIAHPSTGVELIRYDFTFSAVNPLTAPGLKNPNTLLSYGLGTAAGAIGSVGDAQQNYTQTYTVTKVVGTTSTVIGSGLLTPPPNVGKNTTPLYNDPITGRALSGATTFAALDTYTRTTVYSLPSGEATFAGSREDGFFFDSAGTFDLLDSRILGPDGFGQAGTGVDGFKGFNVLAIAMQIPLSALPSLSYNTPFFGAKTGVGVYASVSRQRITLRRSNADPVHSGPWIQVNRMGNPVFNEALVALQDKDNYNRTAPTADATTFATYALNPELAFLINFVVFGDQTGQSPLVTTNRTDLRDIYIPDVLRVDTATNPVTLAGQAGFHRLGFLGSDTTTGSVNSSGWPNGRRLGDDVIDIAFTAVASGPAYTTLTILGDNINANDQVYHQVFPYSATPHAGPVPGH
ncbi:MAG: DUF4331 domain-containing protein [Candidatus Tectimicrobiota bacterium]